MLTRDAVAKLSASLHGQKVLSVYLDGRAPDPATRLIWRSTVTAKLSALRNDTLARAPHERTVLDRCIVLLEEQLGTIDGALGAPGYVAFVTPDGVALAERLPVAMPNVAVWEEGPWISPYLRALKELRPVVMAVVDARSARSYRYALGVLSPLERFHSHVQIDQATHMGATPRAGFHAGTRGATATDAIDRARQHGTERMLRQVVEHLTSVAAADEWIVIAGAPMNAGLVLTMLPSAARSRAAMTSGITPTTAASALRRTAAIQARQLRQRLDREIVDAAIGHAAERGRGSVGEASTRAALEIGDVHMLLMSTRLMNDGPMVAEELARLALSSGAAAEIVTGPAAARLDRAGGVAAVLRYALPPHIAPDGTIPLPEPQASL